MEKIEEKNYSEPWIVRNIGISREALAIYRGAKYEKYKFVEPITKNEDFVERRYYSKRDIQKIMKIKMLVDMGYSLKEIQQIEDKKTDSRDVIVEKIEKLEKEKEKIDLMLGVTEMIKVTGKYPLCAITDVDKMKYEDFLEKVVKEWNANNEPTIPVIKKITNTKFSLTEEDKKIICDDMNIQSEDDIIKCLYSLIHILKLKKALKTNLDREEIKVYLKVVLLDEYLMVLKEYPNVSYKKFLENKIETLLSSGDIAIYIRKHLTEKEFKILIKELIKQYKEIEDEK